MKSFLEEYGLVVVVAIVVLALVAVAFFFKTSGTKGIQSNLQKFEDQAKLNDVVKDTETELNKTPIKTPEATK